MKHSLIVLLLCVAAFAQQPAPAASTTLPADQQATREDISRLFAAMRLEKTLNNFQETMLANMEKMMEQVIPQTQLDKLTPAQRKKYDAYQKRNRDRAFTMYPIKEMLDDMTPVYQHHLRKADVDGIVAFFESPTGQHWLDVQPEMMQEGMAVLMPKMQQRMSKMIEEMQHDAEEIFKDEPAPPKT
ncbi:MAG TPA: DUF2059 domain-containing protein [Terriglobales bacterium]|nr:DUF2059 domain-containing protein [Terriglobales bacterium]